MEYGVYAIKKKRIPRIKSIFRNYSYNVPSESDIKTNQFENVYTALCIPKSI